MSARQIRPWSDILIDAIVLPGVIADAYHQFWHYSVGNQLLALFQCVERHLQLGPIHSFIGWMELGRHVKKGEKGLSLCMPLICRVQPKDGEDASEGNEYATFTRFVYRPRVVPRSVDPAQFYPRACATRL